MPWKEHRKMSLKLEFVEKASRPGARVSELCRQYGVSRETGYKWLKRFKREGYEGLEEQSRAPHSSPLMKAEELVQGVLMAREGVLMAREAVHGARALVVASRFNDGLTVLGDPSEHELVAVAIAVGVDWSRSGSQSPPPFPI
jgi:transposase-like protein